MTARIIPFPTKARCPHCEADAGLAHNCHQCPDVTCYCCGDCEDSCRYTAINTSESLGWKRLLEFIGELPHGGKVR